MVKDHETLWVQPFPSRFHQGGTSYSSSFFFSSSSFSFADRIGCRIPTESCGLDVKLRGWKMLCLEIWISNFRSTVTFAIYQYLPISTTCQVLGMKTGMSPLQEQSTGDAFAASCFSSSFFSTWWSFMTFAASIRQQENRPGVKRLNPCGTSMAFIVSPMKRYVSLNSPQIFTIKGHLPKRHWTSWW